MLPPQEEAASQAPPMLLSNVTQGCAVHCALLIPVIVRVVTLP
jgi:hypothetical protein